MSLRAGDRAEPPDEWHRPPAGEAPQAGSLCHYGGWAWPILVPKLQLGNVIIRQTSGLPPLIQEGTTTFFFWDTFFLMYILYAYTIMHGIGMG